MKKLIALLFFLTLVVISGCAVEQGSGGVTEVPVSHQGHHH